MSRPPRQRILPAGSSAPAGVPFAPPAFRPGFTLIELLVVIAVIGVLVALLLPAVQGSRETARRAQCADNLKQMGLAIHAYHDSHGYFPSTWVNGDESWTWARSLLPYLEKQELYDAWNAALGVFDDPNARIAARPIKEFQCPSSPSRPVYDYLWQGVNQRYGTSDYKSCQSVNASDPLLAGWGLKDWIPGVISRWPVKIDQVRDGLSTTILLVESTGGVVVYGPDRRPFSRIPRIWYPTDGAWMGRALSGMSPTNFGALFKIPVCTVNCTNMYDYGPYSFHVQGAQCLMGDGAVLFLVEHLDPRILSAMYSYDDAQPVRPPTR